MTRGVRSLLVLVSAVALAAVALVGFQVPPAQACVPPEVCPGDGTGPTPPKPDRLSDGTKVERVTTPSRTCSVYANGGGMGSYCVTLGGGNDVQTLRERFGGQKLQRCRYGEVPPGFDKPFNPRPAEGRYRILRCLGNIDYDTYSGGRDRTLDISMIWVSNDTDTADRTNPITEFLWDQINNNTQLPVPFMVARPNPTPLVGIPTYFTFRWIDPSTNEVIAQGPFADREQGGPYRSITENGFTMQAEATSISIDPNQEGIDAVTCDPTTPYREGARPEEQPGDACSITFPRSSASARELATEPIPDTIDEAFYADIEIRWEVRYGEGDAVDTQLGDGFTMRLQQPIPVQEVQTPNQPPIVVF